MRQRKWLSVSDFTSVKWSRAIGSFMWMMIWNSLERHWMKRCRNLQRIQKGLLGDMEGVEKEGYHFNGCYSKDSTRETEVILTKVMVMERDTCSALFQYSFDFEKTSFWTIDWDHCATVNTSLCHSCQIMFMVMTGGNNYAMEWLDVWSAPEEWKIYSTADETIISMDPPMDDNNNALSCSS